MKQVKKAGPPPEFVRYLKTHRRKDWEAFSKPQNGTVKGILGEWLREEQGFLCCYCEEEIAKGISHIEHFKPKSHFPELQLDYFNLFASCNGCGKHEDMTCGMKKKDIYFPSLISPSDPTCDTRFCYTADGQILPMDETDDRGWETIALLGLNSPRLRRRREMVYQELQNLQTLFAPEDFHRYIRIRLEKNPKGRFCEFWTTVLYFTQDALSTPKTVPEKSDLKSESKTDSDSVPKSESKTADSVSESEFQTGSDSNSDSISNG